MRTGYINAVIHNSDATAFLVDEGRIVLTGTDPQIRRLLTKDEEVVDLSGMYVVPGFTDTHMHLLELGAYLYNVQLAGCRSNEEIAERIRSYMNSSRMQDWILGRGYNEDLFTVPGKPDKAMLDAISKEHPIVLTRVCGHKIVCNSKALELSGIDENTQVEGGRIFFDQGIVEENAIPLVHKAQPVPDEHLLEEYIKEGASFCNRFGITTVGSDDFLSVVQDWKPVLNVFERMSYQETLNVRVNEQCEFTSPKDFASFLDEGYTMDVGNDFFRIGPLKLITDGSLGARTAALSRPYSDAPEARGYMLLKEDEIRMYVELANRFNMSTIAHAIGDDAVDTMLRVFKDTVYEGNPLHHGLVHCQILRPAQIRRIIDLKLSCYFQSLFIDYDATILQERAGDLSDSSYPFASLCHGTLASNGSDAPVEIPDVMKGIQLAVTRKSFHEGYAMNPEECLTIEEALDSYTVNGAKQLFMNDCIGSIEAGKYADFVVLDRNILKADPERITEAKIMMTVMNGRTVYER